MTKPGQRRADAAYVLWLAVGAALVGLMVRIRVQLTSSLPSDDPLRWLGRGLVEDVAVGCALGAAALLTGVAARGLFTVVAAATVALVVAWGEALIYYGHAPRGADLAYAFKPAFIRQSVDAGLLIRLSIVAVALTVAVRVARGLAARAGGCGWLLVVGAGACGLSAVPVPTHLAVTADNPLLAAPRLLRVEAAWRQEASAAPLVADAAALRGLAGSELAYVGDRYPLAYGSGIASSRLPAGLKPNIVFVVMEGVRAHEVGCYGGQSPSITPKLDALAGAGIRVDRAYSTGTHTPEGELGLLYGLLATPGGLVINEPGLQLAGLPEALTANGWRTLLWIHNSEMTFYGEDKFLGPRGFRTIDGRDFNPSEPRTNWGYSDRALMARAVLALDRSREPFAAMVLTISNHHPFQVPPDARIPIERIGFGGSQAERMRNTVRYTDDAVGEFFELAGRHVWFRNTIFVITSDHGLPFAPTGERPTRHELAELRHRVPLILYSPLLTGGVVLPGPASHADVAPTLLGLLGLRGVRSGTGADLLSPEPRGPVVAWAEEAREVTIAIPSRTYHAVAADGGAVSNELLVDSVADPAGSRNLVGSEPAARYHQLAEAYLRSYTQLVRSGRSGIPATAVARQIFNR